MDLEREYCDSCLRLLPPGVLVLRRQGRAERLCPWCAVDFGSRTTLETVHIGDGVTKYPAGGPQSRRARAGQSVEELMKIPFDDLMGRMRAGETGVWIPVGQEPEDGCSYTLVADILSKGNVELLVNNDFHLKLVFDPKAVFISWDEEEQMFQLEQQSDASPFCIFVPEFWTSVGA